MSLQAHTPDMSLSSKDAGPRGTGPFSPFTLQDSINKGITAQTPSLKGRRGPLMTGYRSISWMFGFRDKYSLLIAFICGGALVGMALARVSTMNPSKLPGLLNPGEWFWLHQPMYKIPLMIHIYLATLVGLFSVLQFFPTIRRRRMFLHRLNGYGVLSLLLVAMICGGIVARRAFGGELNAQSAYYIQAIMVVSSGLLGVYNVKRDTRRHRKWMLRMVAYFGTAITARLIALAARAIISQIGSYFISWRCDEVINILNDATASRFPQCVTAGVNPATEWVSVRASTSMGPLYDGAAARVSQGMALWISTVLNMAAVEFYILKTEIANGVRIGFVLEHLDFSGDMPTNY